MTAPSSYKYETVAASQTAQVLGTDGAVGDRIYRLIVTAATSATATVALLDGATSIPITAANTSLRPFTIDFGPEGIVSVNGPWAITTGAGASVIALGNFS